MSYRRVMIFQRFSRNKLEKKKQNAVTVANLGLPWQIPAAQCHASHAKPGWTWGERVRKFEGARCLVSKFMDLFDTAL